MLSHRLALSICLALGFAMPTFAAGAPGLKDILATYDNPASAALNPISKTSQGSPDAAQATSSGSVNTVFNTLLSQMPGQSVSTVVSQTVVVTTLPGTVAPNIPVSSIIANAPVVNAMLLPGNPSSVSVQAVRTPAIQLPGVSQVTVDARVIEIPMQSQGLAAIVNMTLPQEVNAPASAPAIETNSNLVTLNHVDDPSAVSNGIMLVDVNQDGMVNSRDMGTTLSTSKELPSHVFDMNNQDTGVKSETSVNDFFLEDHFAEGGFSKGSNVDQETFYDGTGGSTITVSPNGNRKVYLLDGNVWLNNTNSFSSTGTSINIVSQGNIMISDNLLYDNIQKDAITSLKTMRPGNIPDPYPNHR